MYQKFFGSSFANFKWVISSRNSDDPIRFCAKWNCYSYKGSLKMHFQLSYHFNSFLTQWGTSGPNSKRRFWWLCQSAFPGKPPMVTIHTRWTKLLWDWERCGSKVNYFSLAQKIAYAESKLRHIFVTSLGTTWMLEATLFGRDTFPAWWHKSMKSMALTTVS